MANIENERIASKALKPVVKTVRIGDMDLAVPVQPRTENTSDGSRTTSNPRVGYETQRRSQAIEKLGGALHIQYVSGVRLSPRDSMEDIVADVIGGRIDLGLMGKSEGFNPTELLELGLEMHRVGSETVLTRLQPNSEHAVIQITESSRA